MDEQRDAPQHAVGHPIVGLWVMARGEPAAAGRPEAVAPKRVSRGVVPAPLLQLVNVGADLWHAGELLVEEIVDDIDDFGLGGRCLW